MLDLQMQYRAMNVSHDGPVDLANQQNLEDIPYKVLLLTGQTPEEWKGHLRNIPAGVSFKSLDYNYYFKSVLGQRKDRHEQRDHMELAQWTFALILSMPFLDSKFESSTVFKHSVATYMLNPPPDKRDATPFALVSIAQVTKEKKSFLMSLIFFFCYSSPRNTWLRLK